MVVGQEKPMNERGRAAPRGRMTWMAIAGIVVFLVLLFMLFVRPGAPDKHGGERPTAPGAPGDASPAQGSQPNLGGSPDGRPAAQPQG